MKFKMLRKIICKFKGHEWVLEAGCTFCERCGKDYDNYLDRSDLDESENVHSHKKWLDEHID